MSEHSQGIDEVSNHSSDNGEARKHRRSIDADELQLGVESQSSTASVDQELGCGICLDLLSLPYTIIPCLHTFDKGCLIEWWKQNSNCPTCKKTSTSAKSAFQLRAIMEHVHKNKKRKVLPPTNNSTSDEIFPLNGGHPAPAYYDDGSDDYRTDSELGADDSREELVWQCDACIPNNPTGYTCPTPLPPLTPDQLQAAPLPGSRRMSLHQAVAMGVPGASDHAQCISCGTYVPLGYPGRIKCGGCSKVHCHNFTRGGCPTGGPFYSRSDVKLTPHSIANLTTFLPLPLKQNRHEVERLINYVNTRNFSLDVILAALFEAKRNQVAEDLNEEVADDRWGPNAWFCYPCLAFVTSSMLYGWWARERSRSLERQAGIIIAKPDCWYGRECRTQTHSDSHADRFNHICEHTRR